MLISRFIAILLFSAVLTKAKEAINETKSDSGREYDQVESCCVIEDHSFHSFDAAIRDLTNNTAIKIVELKIEVNSSVTVEHLENVAIIGYGISTVDCVSIGTIHFISCNNVTIRGINWERCGSSNELSYPGIKFYKTSNVTIQNCSFTSSLTQAVVFSQVLGDVYIYNSVFTHNTQHRGHGAAVQYTPESTTHTQTKLMINNCNFSYNGDAKSVIYIDGSGNKQRQYSYLQNSMFIGNEGVPVYLLHHNYKLEVMYFLNKMKGFLVAVFSAACQLFYL